jgi:hypothetical protein
LRRHVDHLEHHRDHRQRRAGDAGGADAAQHADQHDHQLLPEAQVDAVDLGQEQHGHALEQRRAVLVHRRAGGEHEARDRPRQAQLGLGDPQRGRQGRG